MLVTGSRASGLESSLCVEREGIRWWSLEDGRVRIEITVQNHGPAASEPDVLAIESAPFGAFLPWSPLAAAAVPAIPAYGAAIVRVDVDRTPVQPSGDSARVPVDRLLTALAFEEERVPAFWFQGARPQGRLARDLMELHGRPLAYWVGNLNVHLGVHAVERHLAQPLRIHPGCINLAQMLIGTGEYRFSLDTLPYDLTTRVFPWTGSWAGGTPDRCLTREGWVRLGSHVVLAIQMEPSPYTTSARVQVHVTRRQDCKEAVVEFSMDASARGPGCYTV